MADTAAQKSGQGVSWGGTIVSWLVGYALYMAFAGSLSWREFVAGAMWAVAGTAVMAWFAKVAGWRFSWPGRELLPLWRYPWSVVSGLGQLARAWELQLFFKRGAASVITATPFAVGPEDSPADAMRRAVATAASTSTPNTIILGFLPRREVMVYHQIDVTPLSKMTQEWGTQS